MANAIASWKLQAESSGAHFSFMEFLSSETIIVTQRKKCHPLSLDLASLIRGPSLLSRFLFPSRSLSPSPRCEGSVGGAR